MESIWAEGTNIIKEKISQQNFDTWIRPIRIYSIEENNIYLSVPNKFFKEWLIENYLSIINGALTGVIGTIVNINFLVKKDDSVAPIPIEEKKKKVKKSPAAQKLHPSLNPNYSFERFIVGGSNQFAHAAAISVAEQPASNYNPLFIYGGVGLGKTHLINAIGLHTYTIHTDKSVLYVSAEQFMNELINSIRYDKMPNFREKFRKIDFLLIDDIQFIAGKDRTQEEFFHTFNTLHDSGKQIVVTSDKFPKDIPNLEGRLRSRFEWGLIADIQPPELETRVAIVEKKAYENNMNISSDVTHYIASVADSNIRELEGMLTRVAAYSSLTGRETDIDVVKEVFKNLLKQRQGKKITVDEIIKVVALKFNMKVSDIKSQKKNKNLILPRQIVMYISRQLTDLSFPDIGSKVGGRDHSTVIYSTNKVKKIVNTDIEVKRIVEEIEDTLQTKS
ncbi:MAG: chromosomal replication initiator protein DnaA [Deltaproteobacteria bacterium]|nr:chromosomal replication initiator protein DnaA [Deltaproteobacteria bacterium]MBN2846594.1 chromosomal replication initiator protein DnaA [Deltaproteobacteria bacterium]